MHSISDAHIEACARFTTCQLPSTGFVFVPNYLRCQMSAQQFYGDKGYVWNLLCSSVATIYSGFY